MLTTELQEYTCDRCGYVYHKIKDYQPFLCHRCMRFIAKKTYTAVKTIIPPVSSGEVRRDI